MADPAPFIALCSDSRAIHQAACILDSLTAGMVACSSDAGAAAAFCSAVVTVSAFPGALASLAGSEAVVLAMNKHPACAEVQERACDALLRLVDAYDEQEGLAGAVAPLVAAMSAHPASGAVQAGAVRALRAMLAVGAGMTADVTSSGAAEAAVCAMASHPASAEVQSACAELLLPLSHSLEGCERIVASGGVEALVAALSTHADDPALRGPAVRALENVTSMPGTHSAAVRAGGLEALVGVIRLSAGDLSVLYCACSAMNRVAHSADRYLTRMLNAGAAEAIMRVMHAGASSAVLHAECCVALHRMAFGSTHRRDCVAELGGVDAVVASLRCAGSSEAVATAGVTALRAICAGSKRRQRELAGGDGLRALLGAMLAHPDCYELQMEALEALSVLGLMSEARPALVGAVVAAMRRFEGAPELLMAGVVALRGVSTRDVTLDAVMQGDIVEAMLHNPASEALQASACGALMRMEVSTESGMEAVVGAIRRSPDALALQEAACNFLWNTFTCSDELTCCASRAGAVPAILAAMRAHEGAPWLNETACKSLSCILAADGGSRAEACALGVPVAAVSVLRRFGVSSAVAAVAASQVILCGVTAASDLLAAVDAGLLRALVAAMAAHPNDAILHCSACMLMQQAAVLLEQRRELLAAEGGLEALVASMGAHAGDASLQQAAVTALHYTCVGSGRRVGRAEAAGAVEALAAAMRANPASEDIQQESTMALLCISHLSSTPGKMAAAGAFVAVMDSACSARSEEAAEAALIALGAMVRTPVDWEAAVDAGAVEHTAEAMRRYPRSSTLFIAGCRVLRDACAPAGGADRLMEAQGIDLIVDMQTAFADNARIQKAGNSVLAALADNSTPLAFIPAPATPDASPSRSRRGKRYN